MRRLFLIYALALMPMLLSAQFRSGVSYEDLDDSETVAAIKSHVRTLSAAHLEGRKAGSEGEKEAAEYVEHMFEEYGIELLPFPKHFFCSRATGWSLESLRRFCLR